MTSPLGQLARTVLPRQAGPDVFTRARDPGWIAGLGAGPGSGVVALPPIVIRFEHHHNAERDIVSKLQRPAFEIEVMLVGFPPSAAAGEPLWFAYARSSTTPARVLSFRCDRDADPRRAVVAQGEQAASAALVERWASRHAGAQDGPFQYELLTYVFRALGTGDSTPLAGVAPAREVGSPQPGVPASRTSSSRAWLWIVGSVAVLALVIGGWAMFVARGKASDEVSLEQATADNERVRGFAFAISVDNPPAFACKGVPPNDPASLFVVIPPALQGRAERRTEVGLRARGPGTGSMLLGQVIDLGEPARIKDDDYTARMRARVAVELVQLTRGSDGALTRSSDAACGGVVSGSFLVSTTPGGIETSLHTAIDNLVRMAVCRTQPDGDCAGYERGGVELAR